MSKKLVALILLICFAFVIPYCYENRADESKSQCLKNALSDEEKEEYKGYKPDTCCFYKIEGEEDDTFCAATPKS